MIYLDNSATTRQADEVTKLMVKVAEESFGNPSSLHGMGLAAQNLVTDARRQVAELFDAEDDEVVFNSGGTEGDNTAILGLAHAGRRKGDKVIISAVEHPAVMETVPVLEERGFEVAKIGVGPDGLLDMSSLEDALDDRTVLVSVMTVNNETGALMPVERIGKLARKHGAYFHTDAVQAVGLAASRASGAHVVTMSGHKIHGPKGTGANIVRKDTRLAPFIYGGGQEKGRRSGTENVPGIAGLGLACSLIKKEDEEKIRALRDRLLKGIADSVEDIRINTPEGRDHSAPGILNISFVGTRGEVILHSLEDEGIYVSTGSACSSNKKGQSHVLKAMGLSDREIEGAIRFSISRYNTEEEIDTTCIKVAECVTRFRRLGSFR